MTVTEQDLQPGEVLSDTYEIVRKIARGGMGSVYEARHRRLSARRVAIKVLRTDTSLSQREVTRRFRREAEICSELSHPNIISVTDWDTADGGQPFFVMEYLEGESLDRRMSRNRMPVPLVLKILGQAGAALQYAHDRSIIHRDLKPSNIFLVSTGVDADEASFVKVLDFGISKILTASTLETTESKIIGSPRYMSPEQARGQNEEITPSSDQFGLATVAYEMLAGKAAFVGDTLSSVLFNIVYEQPEPLVDLAPDVDPQIIWVVNKAMSKEPSDRYPCVADFIRDLTDAGHKAGALADDVADTLITGARRSIGTTKRRWWPAVVPPLLVGAALVVAWAVWWPRSDRDTKPADTVENTGTNTGNDEPAKTRAPTKKASPDKTSPTKKTPVTKAKDPVVKKPPPPPPKPSAAVQARLDEAERLLEAGQYKRAIREANRTIGKQDTSQARRIVTLAYCGMGHLEMAKASFRKVWAGDRGAVTATCKKNGIDL